MNEQINLSVMLVSTLGEEELLVCHSHHVLRVGDFFTLDETLYRVRTVEWIATSGKLWGAVVRVARAA